MATLANGTQFHKLNEGGTAYEKTYTDVTNVWYRRGRANRFRFSALYDQSKLAWWRID